MTEQRAAVGTGSATTVRLTSIRPSRAARKDTQDDQRENPALAARALPGWRAASDAEAPRQFQAVTGQQISVAEDDADVAVSYHHVRASMITARSHNCAA